MKGRGIGVWVIFFCWVSGVNAEIRTTNLKSELFDLGLIDLKTKVPEVELTYVDDVNDPTQKKLHYSHLGKKFPIRSLTYRDGKVIQEDFDRNEDGKIDQTTIFNINQDSDDLTIKTILFDRNGDGVQEHKKEYQYSLDRSHITIISSLRADLKSDFEVTTIDSIEADQKVLPDVAECTSNTSAVDQLLSSHIQINQLAKAELPGFYITPYGLFVHQSCFDHFGESFVLQNLREMVAEGTHCLKEIGNIENLERLTNLLTQGQHSTLGSNAIKIICDEEKGYDWSTTVAHASSHLKQTPNAYKIPLNHPYISINPYYRSTVESTQGNLSLSVISGQEFKEDVFHESFHNMGYLHNEDIEYSYTCEVCCMNDPKKYQYDFEREIYQAACKVCAGGYSTDRGINDPFYMRDIVNFLVLSFKKERAIDYLAKYIQHNQKDEWAFKRYLELNVEKGDLSSLGTVNFYLQNQDLKKLFSSDVHKTISRQLQAKVGPALSEQIKTMTSIREIEYQINHQDNLDHLYKLLTKLNQQRGTFDTELYKLFRDSVSAAFLYALKVDHDRMDFFLMSDEIDKNPPSKSKIASYPILDQKNGFIKTTIKGQVRWISYKEYERLLKG